MLISLQESEIHEIMTQYSVYRIDPAPSIQSNWVTRKFTSTGRTAYCVVQPDGTLVVKQLQESAVPQTGMPLWL